MVGNSANNNRLSTLLSDDMIYTLIFKLISNSKRNPTKQIVC